MNIKFFSVLLILLISLNTKADTYNKYLKCWSSDQQFVVLAQWNSTFEMLPLYMKLNYEKYDLTGEDYLSVISYQPNGFNFRIYQNDQVGIFMQMAIRTFVSNQSTGIAKGFDLGLTDVTCNLSESVRN